MTAIIFDGQTKWNLQRDVDGHRTYNIQHRVLAAFTDGPFTIMQTPGLPLIGSIWAFDGDVDPWALCHPNMTVRPQVSNDSPNRHWIVDQVFSTKPINRCQDTSIEDPTLEPDRVSGSAVKYTTNPEAPLEDKDGDVIQSLSFEPFRGLEFDANRHQVRISQNVGTLDLGTVAAMVDTVNDDVMWDFPSRNVKLSELSWERKTYGICFFYYVRNLGFDINTDTWDKTVREEGTKVLRAGGDIDDPADWIVHKDIEDNIDGTVLLTAAGGIAGGAGNPAAEQTIQFYKESDFLTLGIPTSIGT